MRVQRPSCLRMQRMVLHPEACTLVRERNLCSWSCEFDQTPTLRSAVIGNTFVWELGCERERERRGGGCECAGG